MFRRFAVAAVAAAATVAVVALPSPAFAADSFTAAVTVVAPSSATMPGTADAAFGAGTIHGFAGFGASKMAIYYFQGGTQGYTRVVSPYRGVVLGVDADETATYLVYEMTDTVGRISGVGVTKRSHAGRFFPTRVLSTAAAHQNSAPTADISAEGGKWWAVWTEQVGQGESAPQQLFQAKTYGTAADHQQITFTGSNIDNAEPSISLDARGAVMAWTRLEDWVLAPGPQDLWVATNANTAWSSRVFSSAGETNRTADLKRIGGSTFLAFNRDGRIIEADNSTGAWTSHIFLATGEQPRVGATLGSKFVAWTEAKYSSSSTVVYARGNTGSQSFVEQTVSAKGTTLDTMVTANGKGTLLIRSALRLYSITSLTAR